MNRTARASSRPAAAGSPVAVVRPTLYQATVTVAQCITDESEPSNEDEFDGDTFQFELGRGQSLVRSSRKYFRSRDVSDVRIGMTPQSHRDVWITQVNFGADVVFRGYARRVHVDAELRPDEQISVVVTHAEVVP